MVLVKLKWNKLTFDNLEINPSTEGVHDLKRKVFELTGVPASRQKLMAKNAWNGVLKDEADFSSVELKPNQQVLLMGTADIVSTPSAPVTFVEDMTSEQKALIGVTLPAGMQNMGNTCYMNSTFQCVRYMKEMRDVLQPVKTINSNSSIVFTNAFKNTLNQLDSSTSAVLPTVFVQLLRAHFPQFAQIQNGHYMQQDAEEFFNILSSEVSSGLQTFNSNIDPLLSIQMEQQLSCSEAENEPIITATEKVNKLVCNIQGSVGGSQIDHLHDGVKLALEGTLEKQSTILNRNALWRKSQRISALPKFLCVHFMRFFWKATPENRDHRGVKCKILRAVTFPDVLDVYDYCSEGLQRKLKVNREAVESKITSALNQSTAPTSDTTSMDVDSVTTSTTAGVSITSNEAAVASDQVNTQSGDTAMAMELDELEGIEDEEEREALRAALLMSMTPDDALPVTPISTASTAITATPLLGSVLATTNPVKSTPTPVSATDLEGLPIHGFTGHYELHSLVTHKGRSADSGHYIGWVRQAPGSNAWWKFDDDVVTEVDSDEIMRLKGGGDKDMTYLVFYRFKQPAE